jgi:hypothetical protein
MLDNTGLFVTDDLNNIVDPVTNATFVFLTTDGQLYAFNGVGYDQISGGGAGSGITTLTGDVTAGPGSGSQAATLAASGVVAGSYTSANLTVDAKGRLTAAANGSGGGSGALTLVEAKTITGDAQSATFSGLNGDADGIYSLQCAILNGGSTSFYTLQPNGVTSNQTYSRGYTDGTTFNNNTGSTIQIGFTIAAQQIWTQTMIYARKNPNSVAMPRRFYTTFHNWTGALNNVGNIGATWNETATNMTSLVVTGDQADSIKSGSQLYLYKYAQS